MSDQCPLSNVQCPSIHTRPLIPSFLVQGRIEYEPPMPAKRDLVTQRMFMADIIK